MSAYVVSNDTIDYLVTASRLWRLDSDGYLPYDARNLTDNELGQVLLSENVRSVNTRYNETDEAPAYDYQSVSFAAIDAVTVLKSVQCVNYQSCETDDWKTTLAYQVLKAIESGAISKLRGYSDAPWGWTRPTPTPVTLQKAVRLMDATHQIVRYTVTLTIERPIRREDWDSAWTEAEHLASYTDFKTRRELEREVLTALRKLDGDADCEVMDAEIKDED